MNEEYILGLASQKGHLALVKYLVSLGVNIHVRLNTPLVRAAHYGKLDVVKYLVSQGANIHVCQDVALKYALEKKHDSVIEYLLSLDDITKYDSELVKKCKKYLNRKNSGIMSIFTNLLN